MSQMLELVQKEVESGELDEFQSLIDQMGRAEDLFWKEGADGSLYFGAEEFNPELVGRVTLKNGSFTAEEVEQANKERNWWSNLNTLSTPQQAQRTQPQFD